MSPEICSDCAISCCKIRSPRGLNGKVPKSSVHCIYNTCREGERKAWEAAEEREPVEFKTEDGRLVEGFQFGTEHKPTHTDRPFLPKRFVVPSEKGAIYVQFHNELAIKTNQRVPGFDNIDWLWPIRRVTASLTT